MYYVLHVPILKERMTIPERKMHTLAFSILFASFSLSFSRTRLDFLSQNCKNWPTVSNPTFFPHSKSTICLHSNKRFKQTSHENEFFYFLFRKLRSENQNLGCTQRGSATSDLDNAEAPYICSTYLWPYSQNLKEFRF